MRSSEQHANGWLDPDLSPLRAKEIAKELCQPTEEFEWFPVGKAVGNVRNKDPEPIEPDPSAEKPHDEDHGHDPAEG